MLMRIMAPTGAERTFLSLFSSLHVNWHRHWRAQLHICSIQRPNYSILLLSPVKCCSVQVWVPLFSACNITLLITDHVSDYFLRCHHFCLWQLVCSLAQIARGRVLLSLAHIRHWNELPVYDHQVAQYHKCTQQLWLFLSFTCLNLNLNLPFLHLNRNSYFSWWKVLVA